MQQSIISRFASFFVSKVSLVCLLGCLDRVFGDCRCSKNRRSRFSFSESPLSSGKRKSTQWNMNTNQQLKKKEGSSKKTITQLNTFSKWAYKHVGKYFANTLFRSVWQHCFLEEQLDNRDGRDDLGFSSDSSNNAQNEKSLCSVATNCLKYPENDSTAKNTVKRNGMLFIEGGDFIMGTDAPVIEADGKNYYLIGIDDPPFFFI